MSGFFHKSLRQVKRVTIAVVGFTVLAIGLVMIVLPGPAFLVIPVALGILATEFVWAKNVIKKVKSKLPIKKPKEETAMALKPSEKEEEYFARMEFERRKKIEGEKHEKLAEDEKKGLKELHFMRCPKCGMPLLEIDYKTIKIDKCSECDGIWLDAGEMETVSTLEKTGLDKLFSVFKK
jgi:hypothetical protein